MTQWDISVLRQFYEITCLLYRPWTFKFFFYPVTFFLFPETKSTESVQVMATAEENALITSLREHMADVEPLPDEQDFFRNKETWEYQKGDRDWEDAEGEGTGG